jgi:hypothetical protein
MTEAPRTVEETLAARGLRSPMPALPHTDPTLAEILSGIRPLDAATDDEPAPEPTIEELLLASDEPLRVLAMPLRAGCYGVFLGALCVQEIGFLFMDDMMPAREWCLEYARSVEQWRKDVLGRKDVLAQRAEPEAPATVSAVDITNLGQGYAGKPLDRGWLGEPSQTLDPDAEIRP